VLPPDAPAPRRGDLPDTPVIASARALTKTYGHGSGAVHALAGVDVDLGRGELTAIMGPSGSGKSTLMHCLAGLDRPTSGEVVVDGRSIGPMSERQLTALRRECLGFVFQSFNLVPTLTARENILLPLRIAGRVVDAAWFEQLVGTVGLGDRLGHRPAELSGGQQQRVAVARALVGRPAVVFADEPTGNLDSSASHEVLALLRSSVDELGQSVVMVTHDPVAASWSHRVLFLADGAFVAETLAPTTDSVLEVLHGLTRGAR
jgi:putative ABC transport system ATP-binding protein